MSTVKNFKFTLYGQKLDGISFPIGSSVTWTFDLEDPFTRDPIDLTVMGTNVTMSCAALDPRGNPSSTILISHQATPSMTPINRCVVDWTVGDTIPSGVPFAPNQYAIDVWFTDASGNRVGMTASTIVLSPALTLPSTPITPTPSQSPLGLGPTGPQGPLPPRGSSILALAAAAAAGSSTNYAGEDHQHPGRIKHDTISIMRSGGAPNSSTAAADLGGYSVNGDGGGGPFWWDNSSTLSDDGGMTIKPTAVSGAGRWRRVASDSYVNVKWFGAKGDNSTDDYNAINAALGFLAAQRTEGDHTRWGGELHFPGGTFLCGSPINVRATLGLTISGENNVAGSGSSNFNSSTLVYTGTGSAAPDPTFLASNVVRPDSRFIDARSTIGLTLRNMTIGYNNTGFEGNLVDLSHSPDGITAGADSSYFVAEGCNFTGVGPGGFAAPPNTAYCCISLWLAILCTVKNCHFGYAGAAIRGDDGAGYSNAHTVENCYFDNINTNTAWLDCSTLAAGNMTTKFRSKALGGNGLANFGPNQWAYVQLNSWGGNCDTYVQAITQGEGGNDIHVSLVGDSVSGVSVVDAWPNVTIHFQPGVSTVSQVETAIATSTLIEVGGGNYQYLVPFNPHGTGSNVLTTASNGGGNLANGVTMTGNVGNFIAVTLVGDSVSGVTISETNVTDGLPKTITIHYKSGTSTVGDVEDYVRLHSNLLEIKSSGTRSTVLHATGDNFSSKYLMHGRSGSAIVSPAQGWMIKGCTFEGTRGTYAHMLRAYYCDTPTAPQALSFIGNWFGDAGLGVWIEPGFSAFSALVFEGNFINGQFKLYSNDNGASHTGTQGASICGNWMNNVLLPPESAGIAINAISIKGNFSDQSLANLDSITAFQVDAQANALQGTNSGNVSQLNLTGHISTNVEADVFPTVAPNTAAGSGATASIYTGNGINAVSNDIAGRITLVTGSSPGTGVLFTFTFARTYRVAPRIFLRPRNSATATFDVGTGHWEVGTFNGSGLCDKFTMTGLGAPPAMTTLEWDYFIVQ